MFIQGYTRTEIKESIFQCFYRAEQNNSHPLSLTPVLTPKGNHFQIFLLIVFIFTSILLTLLFLETFFNIEFLLENTEIGSLLHSSALLHT